LYRYASLPKHISHFNSTAMTVTMQFFITHLPTRRPLALVARFVALVFIFVVFNQCATTARTTKALPAQENLWEEILTDIQHSDPFSLDFTASGTLRVEGVGKGTQKLRARLVFRHPGTLYLRGDKPPFGTKVLEWISQNNQWELQLPTENRVLRSSELLNGVGGKWIERIEPAREIFDTKSRLTIVDKTPRVKKRLSQDGRLQLVIRDGRLNRRIVVKGPPWYIVEHHLSTTTGKRLLSVTFLEFQDINRNGEIVRFPGTIRIELHPTKVSIELTRLSPQFSPNTTFRLESK